MRNNPCAHFIKLEERCQKVESSLCIGLDPDPELMPSKLGAGPQAMYRFCADVVEATADYAAAFKPNLAFFESAGVEGWHILEQVLQHVPEDIPVIIDGKRGDIGSTARHYAKSLFECLKADAVTVNPLLGLDSLKPFLDYTDRGVYVLCLTSNPGAEEFQTWFDLYLQVAKRVAEWNVRGNCGLVVGGTKPIQLSNVWSEAPSLPLLVPGVGAQGGDIEMILSEARDRPRQDMLINVSRSVIYASQKTDFARAARKAALAYRDRINQALAGK